LVVASGEVTLTLSHLASAAASSVAQPQDWSIWNLIQFGILGMGFACLASGKFIVPEWALNRAEKRHAEELASERARSAKLEGQVEKLQAAFQDQMIPALTRSTEIIAAWNEESARKRWASDHREGERHDGGR
jgi:F0F1-type ATP synthase membrane subunit b/b'